MEENEYQCAHCQNVYTKGWTDEEAAAESGAAFGITSGDIVCDDCYNQYMYNRAKPTHP